LLHNRHRYEEEDEGGPQEGPVRKSQGADLAELLAQAGAYDAAFHARQRVSLVEEYGLPPAGAEPYQGLSFDLKGLAACLAALPLHQVLDLPAPPGDGEQRGAELVVDGARGDGGAVVQPAPPAAAAAQAERAAAPGNGAAAAAAAAAPFADADEPDADSLLDELLAGRAAPAPAPKPPGPEDGRGGGGGAAAVAGLHEEELDRLLAGQPTAVTPAPVREAPDASIEDWLDAL
jgi:hypothetical protein